MQQSGRASIDVHIIVISFSRSRSKRFIERLKEDDDISNGTHHSGDLIWMFPQKTRTLYGRSKVKGVDERRW